MRAVVQKVKWAGVEVAGTVTGRIGPGFMVLVGCEEGDTDADRKYIADKVANLRIFEDANDKMNLSISDVGGSLLVVSQFTLLADARGGRRPSFIRAARPEIAQPMIESLIADLRAKGLSVETGRFQTHMEVSLLNDGPVTILLDSRKGF